MKTTYFKLNFVYLIPTDGTKKIQVDNFDSLHWADIVELDVIRKKIADHLLVPSSCISFDYSLVDVN